MVHRFRGPDDRVAMEPPVRGRKWIPIFLVALLITWEYATCNPRHDLRRPLEPYIHGDTVALLREGAPFDASPKLFTVPRTLAFWQYFVEAGGAERPWPGMVAAFLEAPFSTREAPRHAKLDKPVFLSMTASADLQGRICLAYVDSEGSGTSILAALSADGGRSWQSTETVHRDGEMLKLDPDSLAPGPSGEWFLLARYRLGKVPPRLLFRIFRLRSGESRWELMGTVPGSDDLSTFDGVGFDASPDGRLAIAFVTYEGELAVAESDDGGRSWSSIGSPGRPAAPGRALSLVGFGPIVRDGMPSLHWLDGGWGLAWEEHVQVPTGPSSFDTYTDTLFAKVDAARVKWGSLVRVNERRVVVGKTLNFVKEARKTGIERMEELHREGRGTGLRYPHLTAARTGRLAVSWTELREERIVPVASFSDDGGSSWSGTVVLDGSPEGDAERVRTGFGADGKTLQAIYLTWPGESSIRSKAGLGVKASEVLLP